MYCFVVISCYTLIFSDPEEHCYLAVISWNSSDLKYCTQLPLKNTFQLSLFVIFQACQGDLNIPTISNI